MIKCDVVPMDEARLKKNQYMRFKKKNGVRVLWDQMKRSDKFLPIILKYRKEFGIPEDGFNGDQSYVSWISSNLDGTKDSHKWDIADFYNEMTELIDKKHKEHWKLLVGVECSYLLQKEKYWASFDESLNMLNISEIRFFVLTDQTEKEKLEDGFYIKIGPYTGVTEFKEFITDSALDIRECQQELIQKLGLPMTIPRIRPATKAERDKEVFKLSRLTKQQLVELGAPSLRYKTAQIASFLNLTEENVKRIVKEQVAKRK